MFYKCTFKLFLSLVLLAIIQIQTPAQTRDLEKYEKLVFVVDPAKESAEPHQTKSREFIWNCWLQKRLCYASLKLETPGELPNRLELFVEPNEKGEYQMVYVIDVQPMDMKGKLKKGRYKAQFASAKVSRVEIVKGGAIKPLNIPDTQLLPADSFRIYVSANKNPLVFGAELVFKNGSATGGTF